MDPQTQKEQTNTELVVDAVLNMLNEKNPLFKTKEDEYKQRITQQFETYLVTGLMNKLTPDNTDEFEKMLLDFPLDKQKHNDYLMEKVPNFETTTIALAQAFVSDYREFLATV